LQPRYRMMTFLVSFFVIAGFAGSMLAVGYYVKDHRQPH
jgi:hypothetical protein